MQSRVGILFAPISPVIKQAFQSLVPILNKMNLFVQDANKEQHAIKSIYRSDGLPIGNKDWKFSPGHITQKQCANLQTIAFLKAFVEKYKLPLTGKPEEAKKDWENALITEFGLYEYNHAINKHNAPERMVVGIRSACVMACGWGVNLNTFIQQCRAGDLESVKKTLEILETLYKDKNSFIVTPKTAKLGKMKLGKIDTKNATAQAIITDLNSLVNSDETHKRSAIVVSASAGSVSYLSEGGGCFGDPAKGSAQEEHLFHTIMSFFTQIFVQFILGEYVETTLEKEANVNGEKRVWYETIDRFMYKEKYAPNNGTVLAIPVLTETNNLTNCDFYLFTAAHDCRHTQIPYEEQFESFYNIFCSLFSACYQHKLDALLMSALGLGVYKCDVDAYIAALVKFYEDYNYENVGTRTIIIKIAYFIAGNKRPDEIKAVDNFNKMVHRFGGEKIFQ